MEPVVHEVRDHFEVNTVGTSILLQAILPLLNCAGDPPMAVTAYDAPKTAANFIVRKIHLEYLGVIAVSIYPG